MNALQKITVKNLDFSYANRKILNHVSFDIESAKITTIIGPNGAGKSTLLKCCNNILNHSDAQVFLEDKDINHWSTKEISKKIGYVPQKYFISVSVSVFESVLVGLHRRLLLGYTTEEIRKVENILIKMGIDNISEQKVARLSGGQQQKVAIARALVNTPPFVFLDEPTSGLDLRNQRDLMQFLHDLTKESHIGVLTILHDINLASEFSDVIIMLKDGYLHANGSPHKVISSENIKKVFHLESKIISHNDRPYVLPL